MNPKISICIPAYQQTAYLKKCLDSIVTQKFTDYEIIITDDSPDSSVEDLLKQYDFGKKLIYKKNSVPLGSPRNWNDGLLLANGELIKIMHHDDWFHNENSLGKFVRLLDENPKADFGFSACYWIFPDREKLMIPSGKQIDKLRENPVSIFPENFISTPSTTIFRNNTSKELFDENMKWLVDTEYYYRCLSKGKPFAFSNEPLVKVLVEASHQVTSVTRGKRDIEIREWIYYYNKIRANSRFNLTNLRHLKKVFDNFNIKTLSDIKDCGVNTVSREIKAALLFNKLRDAYRKYRHASELIKLIKRKFFPENSKRGKIARVILLPVKTIKRVLKNRLLEPRVLLSGKFNPPAIVSASSPIVLGFELGDAQFNYGFRIFLDCEKADAREKTQGRFQINWLDAKNEFVYGTYIPFNLNNKREEYSSELINDQPGYSRQGILYLTSNDHHKMNIYNYSLVGYNIKNKLLHGFLTRKSKRNYTFKITDKPGAKNVLFIIPWMSVGGGDMVNLTLAENLSNRGFNIHFITSEHSKNEWENRFRKITKNIIALPKAIKKIRTHLEYNDLLVAYIKAAKIDVVVISNSEFGYRSLPVVQKEFPHIKTFDILHGQGGEQEHGGFPEYSKPYDQNIGTRITINSYLKQYIIDKYNVASNKIKVIHNGIDTQKFRKTKKINKHHFLITFIGRLSYEKHPEKIIDIAEKFHRLFPDENVQFQIIGNGPLHFQLNEKIVQKKLEHIVKLKGYKDNVKEELEETDVLLLCSEMEGLPIVLLEAMAMSVPCIASNVGGIPELINDEENGFLVNYDQELVEVFVEKLKLLYQNAEQRTLIGQMARQKIENEFSMPVMINAYAQLFQ